MSKISVAALITATLLLSACNMVKGLGRDIESVGEAGDRVVDRAPPADQRDAH
jgi:predicted small secreted protein